MIPNQVLVVFLRKFSQRMSKYNSWPDLTYENRRNYLLIEAPILLVQ